MSRPLQVILDEVKAAINACSWYRMQAQEAQDGIKQELTKLLHLNLEVYFEIYDSIVDLLYL